MFRLYIILSMCSIGFGYCSQNVVAQTKDTSFALLWYKGKKLSDTVVLIPSGQTVKYKPSKGKVEVITPAKQDVLNSLSKELKKGEGRKAELNKLVIGSRRGPLNSGYAVQLSKALDEVHANYKSLSENSMELGVENQTKSSKSANKNIPPHILQTYEEVLDFIRNNSNASSPPIPPSVGFDYCYPCDTDRQAAFKRDSMAFMNWIQQEKDNLAKAMKVIGYFGFRKANKLPYDSSQAKIMEAEMFDAFIKIMERLESKLLQAWNQNMGDETKLPFLTQQMFEFLRAQQLMGLTGKTNFPGALQIAAVTVEAGMKYLSKARKEREYKVLLNIRWIVSLFRTAELLGMNPEQFENSFLDFIKINQFKLIVDARAKMGQDGTVMGARMTGENIFGAIPDSNCVLKWTLIEPDPKEMKFDLEEVSMELPEITAKYTGTRRFKSYPASLQLDFCNDQKDTALLHGFFPTEGVESWIIQDQTVSPANYIYSIYSTCFMDVERLQEMAADPGLQARTEQQMQEKHKQFMAGYQGTKDPSKMTPEEIKKMNDAMLAARDIQNIIQSISPYSFICKERLKNHQKIVFETQLNGKELFPDNPAIIEAILKMKMEHVEE